MRLHDYAARPAHIKWLLEGRGIERCINHCLVREMGSRTELKAAI